MISFRSRGDWNKTSTFLKKASKSSYVEILGQYAEQGVAALSAATPNRTGETANSWSYEIEETGSGYKVVWNNSHINKGVNIAIILQYGHGTGTGGYVEGIDYINPAMRSVFQDMADAAWREVNR